MKLEQIEGEGFKPVTLKMTIENSKELVLLYHVFNHRSLRKAIFNLEYGDTYNEDLSASDFSGREFYAFISEIMKAQGVIP